MTDWDGWQVVCIERSEDSPYGDCRAVEAVGHRVANSLQRRGVDTVHAMIESGLSQFYIAVDGEPQYLQPATHEGRLYVRGDDVDTDEDPLLTLPVCETLEGGGE